MISDSLGSFSDDEIRRLEAGIPDLRQWGKYLLVPFQVRRLRNPEVLWINRRWFYERGFDVQDDLTQKRVNLWLVNEFAFVVKDARDPEEAFADDEREVGADRYGCSAGNATHGGSGRVGVAGHFQVKGIGATPLVGMGTEWIHAHGAASLDEALAEAFVGEVVAAEFPHGGIPVIAVIDTGLFEHLPPFLSGPGGRRALIVRPATLRPAHFERAPFFIESLSGYKNDPSQDAQRVRDAISYFGTVSTEQRDSLNLPADVFELAVRLGEQAAFGDAHRLFSGGFFSSNLALTGALMDYGVMRSLPTWQNVKLHAHAPGFGADIEVLKAVLKSLAFYINKNGRPGHSVISTVDLPATVVQTYYKCLHRNLSTFFGDIESDAPALAEQIGDILLNYFLTQQKTKFQFDWRNPLPTNVPWLGATNPHSNPLGYAETVEHQVFRTVEAVLHNQPGTSEERRARHSLAWGNAKRYLSPRHLTREILRNSPYEAALPSNPEVRPEAIEVAKTVADIVGRNRRHWPNLPAHLQVRAQTYLDGSSALWCVRHPDGRLVLWIEGIHADGAMIFFNGRWPFGSPEFIDILYTPYRWSTTLLMESKNWSFDTELDLLIFGQKVQIPPMQHVYPLPSV